MNFKRSVKRSIQRILPILLLALIPYWSEAQRFAYVNTDRVLKHIPEYVEAQEDLDGLAEQWQKEIERKHKEIDELYNSLQAEEVLLTDEMKKRREQKIMQKKREVRNLQNQRFGKNGDLYKKRKELIQPIQDDVYQAIKKIAGRNNYDLILDSNKGSNVIFATQRYDLTDDVIEELGYEPGKLPGDDEEEEESEGSEQEGGGGSKERGQERKRGGSQDRDQERKRGGGR